MEKIMVRSKSIVFFLCTITQQSIIITNPLPLELPLAQREYLNDKAWNEDARQANANVNHFVEPADTVNYIDYRYVGTHNAHVYPRFFKTVRQQDQTMLGHLSYGVRGLMIDTYNWKLGWPNSLVGPKTAKICLSHPEPGFLAFTQKGIFVYQSFKYELRRVIEFMKVNPQAVITIVIEDYADDLILAKEIKEVMAEAGYDPLFKTADFTVLNKNWPTLGWMRANNKRLVIFTQRNIVNDVLFPQFVYMAENRYSTVDETELCTPRGESRVSGPLVAFNNFRGLAITLPISITKAQVQYDTVKRITTNCQARHFANGRLFNGYWADRIIDSCNNLYQSSKKTIFEYVNELNANPDKTMP